MSRVPSLDPDDWEEARRIFHEAVDCCLDHLRDIRSAPVWRATPVDVKAHFATGLPAASQPLAALLGEFQRDILPYANGNLHPRFWGWVHGAGTVAGAMGEMLAGFLNSNLAGRDHAAVYLERQVIEWCRTLFGFPEDASGLLTSGTSMGTVIALDVARNMKAGADVRKAGLAAAPRRLVGYASREAHSANAKAFDLLGLGEDSLHLVPVDDRFRMSVDTLGAMIDSDRHAGLEPAIVIASAGTVNTGAIDDLEAIAALCAAQGLWFHVDGAIGAPAMLAPELRGSLAAMARADSIAFDFHKWLQVPYDAGGVLIRDAAAHRASFSARREYLARHGQALAGGDPWFCEYGPEMSRGFRALKVWCTIKAYGTARLGAVIAENCRQAKYLAERIGRSAALRLLAPTDLNIVCFRFEAKELDATTCDALNAEIVAELQSSGIAAPSTTRINGALAIRVCIANHRTIRSDLDLLVTETERIGCARLASRRERCVA